MDFSRIKNLVKKNGGKFIFLENGEPEMVIMSFAEYEKMSGGDADDIRWDPDEKNTLGNSFDFSRPIETPQNDTFSDFLSGVNGAVSDGEKESDGEKNEFTSRTMNYHGAQSDDFKDLRGVQKEGSIDALRGESPAAQGETIPFSEKDAPSDHFFASVDDEKPENFAKDIGENFREIDPDLALYPDRNYQKEWRESVAELEKNDSFQPSRDDKEEAGFRLENVRLEDLPL